MKLPFENLRQTPNIIGELEPLREKIETLLDIHQEYEELKPIQVRNNTMMRLCLIVGLSQNETRNAEEVNNMAYQSSTSNRIFPGTFTYSDFGPLFETLIKLRYNGAELNLNDGMILSKLIGYEILKGRDFLLKDNNLESYLYTSAGSHRSRGSIPELNLEIGRYDEDMEATIDINSRDVTNTQILVAGATGSGKTNLLVVLLNQLRMLSIDTPYPVNFLLFDYKGEFSDPANVGWLRQLEVNNRSLLDPMEKPLPFSPFKDFTGDSINAVNLYSTEMASALAALDRTNISANMSNRLSKAIIEAYSSTKGAPITFALILEKYREGMPPNREDDSVTSILEQIVRNHLFEESDKTNIVENSFIIDMSRYPKDGPIAKAIVYFVVSKLNNVYETLEPQAVSETHVQIRHFTVIDEAHYMLDFDNRPLRNLIAVGRNKGMSIILATQNMGSFKSKYFDYYANAQYPLIMKQQTIDNAVIKDLFGVSGNDLQEIRSAIAGLQKGELLIKNQEAYLLELGKKWKIIKVNKII